MEKLIIPTGYMGSGSSALTDLIGEFDGFEALLGSFEYVFLHCPNGVFDLEDKLLVGNNALRSDEALRSFRLAMEELYDAPFWWVGDYRKNLSERFMDITDEYLSLLTCSTSEMFWYHQEERGWKAFPKLAFNKAVRMLTGGKVYLSKPLRYEGMMFSYPTPEEFYAASEWYIQELVGEVEKSLPEGTSGLILDQLILPHNAWRMEHYFDSGATCFIVERDPRDVFLINKYIWTKINAQVPYPLDAGEFVECYRRMRKAERITETPNVYRIRFENLVYRYDETLAQVKDALGIDESVNQRAFEGFDPKRSINNTQLFLLPQFADEAAVIAEGLPEHLYDFPYERMPEAAEVF